MGRGVWRGGCGEGGVEKGIWRRGVERGVWRGVCGEGDVESGMWREGCEEGGVEEGGFAID